MPRKRGRLGKPEIAYITENAQKLGLSDIATHLNRDIETIRQWVRENMALDISGDEPVTVEENEIRNALRKSSEWAELQSQFIPSELAAFEVKYAKLMLQFSNDVLPTEEMQVFHLIKFSILMDRNLKSRARALREIEELETEVDKIYERNADKQMDEADRDRILALESKLIEARDAEANKTSEYVKLSEKHSAILRELKATRDQRFSKYESAKETILGLIKTMQEDEVRQRAGEDLELMKLAAKKEKERLSQSHKYVDDNIDQPLLTPETTMEDE